MHADRILDALALPAQARVDQRVPKKHLIENGSPTASDKRTISDGVEQMLWIASLKPTTIGVPAYEDPVRQYLEIAVLSLHLRPQAKGTRLRELVHRAIPYPVALVTVQEGQAAFSLAHIRNAQNEAGKVVIDGEVEAVTVSDDGAGHSFLASLALAGLPSGNLWHVYQGWFDRLHALEAARMTGIFCLSPNREAADARRVALREIARLDGEILGLRRQAEKEPQLNRRVDLNLEIKRCDAERSQRLAQLG